MAVSKPKIQWISAHPNNFMSGRAGRSRSGLGVPHHIVGTAASALAVFQQGTRYASSHFVLGDSPGEIYQMVSLSDTAYTNGVYESNLVSITLEHAGGYRVENGKYAPYTANMQENAAQLMAWLRDQGLVTKYDFHRNINGGKTVCPGDLPYASIWKRSTEIIAAANKPKEVPAWLKARKAVAAGKEYKVYAHKNNVHLYDLDGGLDAEDSRRWGFNQDFLIGGTTTVDGKLFYITASSMASNKAAGLLASEFKKTPWVQPATEPTVPIAPDSPDWADAVVDDPNVQMYVLRATPLIDLENGRPYKDANGNEVWFKAGDPVNTTAHAIIATKKYQMTEFAFKSLSNGNWKKFANGVDANDLSLDKLSTPEGTISNPTKPVDPITGEVDTEVQIPTSSGQDYMKQLQDDVSGLKEDVGFIKLAVETIINLLSNIFVIKKG